MKYSYSQEEKINFMRRAIELSGFAVDSNFGGPFGAVIVRNGRIVGEGFNSVIKSNDPTAHAEIIAIREAGQNLNTFNLDECVMFTSCEPCPMCFAAVYWANISEIYYANTKKDAEAIGFRDNFIYKELDKKKKNRSKKTEQLLNDEAKKIFSEWFMKQDRVEY